jgi:hypothetical protein
MLGSVPEKAGQNETAGVVIPLDTEGRRDLGRQEEQSARGRGERRDPAHPGWPWGFGRKVPRRITGRDIA